MFPHVLIGGAIMLALVVLFVYLIVNGRLRLTVYSVTACSFYGVLVITEAYAAGTPAVTPTVIPWGNLLVQLLVALTPTIIGLFVLLIGWIFSKLPANVVTVLKAAHADTLLNRAVNQAIALVEGAVKGKTVEITIANQIIATAANLLMQDAPALVAEWGPRLGQIIAGKLADLDMLPADASAKTLNISPTVTVNPPAAVSK